LLDNTQYPVSRHSRLIPLFQNGNKDANSSFEMTYRFRKRQEDYAMDKKKQLDERKQKL
jgi:hypothetical protein